MVRHLPILQPSGPTAEALPFAVRTLRAAGLSLVFWLPSLALTGYVGPLGGCVLFGFAAAAATALLSPRAGPVSHPWAAPAVAVCLVAVGVAGLAWLGGVPIAIAVLGGLALFVCGLVGAFGTVFVRIRRG